MTSSIVIETSTGKFISTAGAADVVIQTCVSAADQLDAVLFGGQNSDDMASSLLALIFHRTTPNNDDGQLIVTLNKATGDFTCTKTLWCDYTGKQWDDVTKRRKEHLLTGVGVLVTHLVQEDAVIEARTAAEKSQGHYIDVDVKANNTIQTISVDFFSFLGHNTRLRLKEQVYGKYFVLFKSR